MRNRSTHSTVEGSSQSRCRHAPPAPGAAASPRSEGAFVAVVVRCIEDSPQSCSFHPTVSASFPACELRERAHPHRSALRCARRRTVRCVPESPEGRSAGETERDNTGKQRARTGAGQWAIDERAARDTGRS